MYIQILKFLIAQLIRSETLGNSKKLRRKTKKRTMRMEKETMMRLTTKMKMMKTKILNNN
jgi:hypothetical protein